MITHYYKLVSIVFQIDETVIPLMTDSDLAKYIPKFGDRVSTVAFCKEAAPSTKSAESRKKFLLSRLRQRVSGAEEMPPKKRLSKLEGNSNAKRKLRRIEVGWMDFDEEEERYKQVKSANGGGTRHLSIDKNDKVADTKVMAENLFFPKGHSKKNNKSLSHYSTHIESSQMHVDASNTIDELYHESKVKLLRLYLCTKKKTGLQPPVGMEGDDITSQHSVVDLIDKDNNQAVEDVNRDSEGQYHCAIDDGASTSGYYELSETLPWDGLQTLGEGEASDIVVFVSEDLLHVTEDQANPVTVFPENDAPYQGVDQSEYLPVLAEDAGVSAQATSEPQSCPVTVIVRRGHCLIDLINAFKDPKIIASEVCIKMRLPNGEIEQGEGSGVLRNCLTEFWTDFYDSCTLGVEVKVPFIRHDFQEEEWQAVARLFAVGWKQASYFPVKLAVPFLEEVLYGTATSSFKDYLLLYVSHEEKSVLMKALEDFDSVDTEELLDVIDAYECKQIPSEETLLPILVQIGHKVFIQAPMYIIKCWRPVMDNVARLLPPEGLHHFIAKRKPTAKTVKALLNFPEEMTSSQSTVCRYLKRYIGEIDSKSLELFLRFCTGSDILDKYIFVEFIEMTDFLRRPQSHTCGCVLKLPIADYSYPDFRSEFNSILTSSMWVMDVV